MSRKSYYGKYEILLPKEFLKENTPNRDMYDFKVKLHVAYSCSANGEDLEIDAFDDVLEVWSRFIKWDSIQFTRYISDAAKNNFESMFKPITQN
jgi:hypothetical protein